MRQRPINDHLFFDLSTDVNNIKEIAMPSFPLDLVREIVMSGLEEAVRVNQVHNRDPIGGSNEDLFV